MLNMYWDQRLFYKSWMVLQTQVSYTVSKLWKKTPSRISKRQASKSCCCEMWAMPGIRFIACLYFTPLTQKVMKVMTSLRKFCPQCRFHLFWKDFFLDEAKYQCYPSGPKWKRAYLFKAPSTLTTYVFRFKYPIINFQKVWNSNNPKVLSNWVMIFPTIH